MDSPAMIEWQVGNHWRISVKILRRWRAAGALSNVV
jgi:hypothetical protein